ncbi:MAG: DUF4382 domain-containing protein [Bacteroidota bacterium]|nr:DUF4382 domain-containing protein [Bacteroidota bacterium]
MNKQIKALVAGGLAFITLILFYACQKESSANSSIPAGKTKLSVFLTDGPYDFQQVLVDIQRIEVKVDTCRRNGDDDHDGPGCDDDHDSLSSHCEIWDTLDIRPGVYDLLTLRNGVDTLLANGFLINGKIERIKVVLGTNNSVMVDSVVHPLHLIDNRNYVYINIHHDHLDSLSSNNFQLFLDFDLAHSIKLINGDYWLKPVLKPFGRHSSGEIEGKVRPVHSFGLIKAFNSTDTAFAFPEDEGEFKIRGLREGTYSLFIDGINGYRDTTINNIMVRRNHETELGTIQLSH